MAGKRSSQARPSSPKNSIMKLAKSFGMINNLFLLRDGIDFSDCLPLEVARKGIGYPGTGVPANPGSQTLAPFSLHQEEMVERGSRQRYERNDEESKSRRLTQNS